VAEESSSFFASSWSVLKFQILHFIAKPLVFVLERSQRLRVELAGGVRRKIRIETRNKQSKNGYAREFKHF